MISDKIKNLVRYTLSLGASNYLPPQVMSTDPEHIKQGLASVGLTAEDILALTTTEASLIGFTKWSEDNPNLYLIPSWLYPALPVGLQVTGFGVRNLNLVRKPMTPKLALAALPMGST